MNVLKSTSSNRVQNTIENILTRISRTVRQAMEDMSQAFKIMMLRDKFKYQVSEQFLSRDITSCGIRGNISPLM